MRPVPLGMVPVAEDVKEAGVVRQLTVVGFELRQ